MDLPKNEAAFYFKHEGKTTGRVYEGDFTVKCVLNLADKRLLEVERSSISLDLNNPSANLNAISDVVSNLRVRVVDAPDWFKQSIMSLDVYDDELFFEIFGKCLQKSDEWLQSLKKESAEVDQDLKRDSEGN